MAGEAREMLAQWLAQGRAFLLGDEHQSLIGIATFTLILFTVLMVALMKSRSRRRPVPGDGLRANMMNPIEGVVAGRLGLSKCLIKCLRKCLRKRPSKCLGIFHINPPSIVAVAR